MNNEIVPIELIARNILFVRDQKVMIDSALAGMYGVETKVLNQTVKRNIDRFPKDFMFQLTRSEVADLKSQIVTSSWGGKRKLPYAFSENGVAMLSSVLKSKKAIEVNIAIIRAFVKLREIITSNKSIEERMGRLEERVKENSETILLLIQELIKPTKPLTQNNNHSQKEKIGFIKTESEGGKMINFSNLLEEFEAELKDLTAFLEKVEGPSREFINW